MLVQRQCATGYQENHQGEIRELIEFWDLACTVLTCVQESDYLVNSKVVHFHLSWLNNTSIVIRNTTSPFQSFSLDHDDSIAVIPWTINYLPLTFAHHINHEEIHAHTRQLTNNKYTWRTVIESILLHRCWSQILEFNLYINASLICFGHCMCCRIDRNEKPRRVITIVDPTVDVHLAVLVWATLISAIVQSFRAVIE